MTRPTRGPSPTDDSLAPIDDLAPDRVAEHLRANPDFFSRYPGLLEELYLPHESGAAISLVTRQVAVLRDRNIDMRNRLSSLSRTAHDNDRLFERTRALMLDAIAAPDVATLIASATAHLRREFGVEHVTLLAFEGAGEGAGGEAIRTRADAAIGHLLTGDRPVTGALRDTELGFLFDGASPPPRSAAVIALRTDRVLGVLALGSADADRFTPAMGTIFLRFTAEVLSRLLARLPR